jgi:hypothetical protein
MSDITCYCVVTVTSFLIFQDAIQCIVTQYSRGFKMRWEQLKKQLSNNNKRLKKLKTTFATPAHNHAKRKTIIAAVCILTLIALITAIEDFGSIKSVVKADSVIGIGVGIYWDKDCTNTTSALNWGFIDPNSTNNLTIYIRNEGNSAVSLRLNSSNWTPSNASNYMSLSWNYSGQVLKTNEVIPIKLTLTVSPTICDIQDFSLQTIITSVDEPS